MKFSSLRTFLRPKSCPYILRMQSHSSTAIQHWTRFVNSVTFNNCCNSILFNFRCAKIHWNTNHGDAPHKWFARSNSTQTPYFGHACTGKQLFALYLQVLQFFSAADCTWQMWMRKLWAFSRLRSLIGLSWIFCMAESTKTRSSYSRRHTSRRCCRTSSEFTLRWQALATIIFRWVRSLPNCRWVTMFWSHCCKILVARKFF